MKRQQPSRTSRTLCVAGLLTTLAGFGPAEAAPQQLLNKTVTYSYTNHYKTRSPSGETLEGDDTWTYTVYISSTGRIFQRSFQRGRMPHDHEPGETRNVKGQVRRTHFEGNRLVHIVAFASGATRDTVSFDPTFSSCTYEVVFARGSDGSIKFKGRDGKLYENLSHSFSGYSCSIRDGNSFAN
jgi:hypothetical protein